MASGASPIGGYVVEALTAGAAQLGEAGRTFVAGKGALTIAASSGAVDDCSTTNDELAHLYPPA